MGGFQFDPADGPPVAETDGITMAQARFVKLRGLVRPFVIAIQPAKPVAAQMGGMQPGEVEIDCAIFVDEPVQGVITDRFEPEFALGACADAGHGEGV